MATEKGHNEDAIGRLLKDFTGSPGPDTFGQIQRRLEKRRRKRFAYLLLLSIGLISTPLLFFLIPDNSAPTELSLKTPEPSTSVKPENTRQESPAPLHRPDNPVNIEPGQTEEKSSRGAPETESLTATHNPGTGTVPAAEPATEPVTDTQNKGPGTVPSAGPVESEVIVLPFYADTLQNIQAALLPVNNRSSHIIREDSISRIEPASLPPLERPKQVKFLLGLFFLPQYTSMHLSGNSNPGSKLKSAGEAYAVNYLAQRKNLSDTRYNYALGIKGGIWLNGRWELMAAAGLQQIRYTEPLIAVAPPGPTTTQGLAGPTVTQSSTGSTFATSQSGNRLALFGDMAETQYENRMRYLLTSIECSRLFSLRTGRMFKIGAALAVNRLLNTSAMALVAPDVYNDDGSMHTRWLVAPSIRIGIVEQITSHLQMQACPVLFMSANSMYKSQHIIKQRVYGVGIEFGIYFRTGK
jgi:hypothetical protein